MMRVIGGLAPALLLGLIVACTGDAPTLLDPPSEATWEAPATSEPTQTVVAPVTLEPGDDIQAIVDRNRAGTRYVLAPGVYREQAVVPKSGDIFEGEPGAVLSGARILEGFSVADKPLVDRGTDPAGSAARRLRIAPGVRRPRGLHRLSVRGAAVR